MHLITVPDAISRLSQLIKRAFAWKKGGSVAGGEAADRMAAPMQPDLAPRQAGQLKGKIWIADNFDEFDEELDEMFYGGKE